MVVLLSNSVQVLSSGGVGINSNTAYQSPQGTKTAYCIQRFAGNIQWLTKEETQLVYLFFSISLPSFQSTASMSLSQPVCGLCHVYGDAHDRNLFSSRFTPDMGNATLLMATRQHPGKPSREEWEMAWRSCWISSRMSICPSGERQVSLKTICPV